MSDICKICGGKGYKVVSDFGAFKVYKRKCSCRETNNDTVNHPSHYTSGGIEVIDFMKAKSSEEEFKGYLRLNVIKYLSRANLKGKTVEDLKKASWYLNRLIGELEDD